MPCHLPAQIRRGGEDGRQVGGLRGLPGGVRHDEVGMLADCGPAGRVVGQHTGTRVEQPDERQRDGRLGTAVPTD